MTRNSEVQLAFDFQQQATANTDISYPASPSKGRAKPVFDAHSTPAVVYCLDNRRAAKIAQESAIHFSAILGLVAHIK
jgi:hypothetical protein